MSAHPARSYLGIGEVLALLRPDFPDITVSKIRFLEAEGLIAPARSPSGYRRFAHPDLERLRYILTAQRDQYLPLRVIKERLARFEAEGAAAGPAARAAAARSTMLSRRELLEATGISESQLSELEDFGLIRRSGRQYGQDALEVAGTVAALAAYGVQARHLRGVRAAAERETSLIEQVIAPTLRQRNPGARDQAGRTARQIAALSLRLHRALVESALAEAGLPGEGGGWPDAAPADGAAPGRPGPAAAAESRAGLRPTGLAGRGIEGASA